ncbi:tyrosine-type recombinase/integrase [Comamonas testosteroni]|uniref:tyrosine-type recombinase/integrase n=1 Tax=Comamonas testosteroni TaxID=285 RepID=UPI0009B90E94|nr:integrase domain-containing protein [Comamonas testosteroni]
MANANKKAGNTGLGTANEVGSKVNNKDDASSIVVTDAARLHPNDPHAQVAYFFKYFRIPAAKGRVRSVSVLTTRKYVFAIQALLKALKSKGVQLNSITDLTFRQATVAFRTWEEEGLSASTLTTYFSCVSRFYKWMHKRFPAESVTELLKDASRSKRQVSITKAKTWSSKGVDFAEVKKKLAEIDRYAAIYLELNLAFGLRVQEAAALKPLESHKGTYLLVMLGAKGGRGRTVQYTNEYQLEVIEKACAIAKDRLGLLRAPGKSLSQAIDRYYYCLKKAGVTQKDLGVTAHGLRHEFANTLYKEQTGIDSPVMGGGQLDPDTNDQTRKVITEALGHSRTSIVSAYIGTVQGMTRQRRKHLNSLNTALCSADGELARTINNLLVEIAIPETEVRVWVNGTEANGDLVEKNPLLLCAGIFHLNGAKATTLLSPEMLGRVTAAATQATGRRVITEEEGELPSSVDRFELMMP